LTIRKALLRTTMLSGIVGAVYLSGNLARAEDSPRSPHAVDPSWYLPAVDGVNGRVEGLGGSLNQKGVAGSQGALAVPLGGQLGFQIDGSGGTLQNRAFDSATGHLFWRNPWQGLLGAYFSYTHWDQFGGVHANQAALEFERYWGRWTLRGIVGGEFGSSASTLSTTTFVVPPAIGIPGSINTFALRQGYDVKSRFMDQLNLQYYLTDDWYAYVGHRYVGGKNALALGSEVGLPLGRVIMASAFVEGELARTVLKACGEDCVSTSARRIRH
jgi:hypothetical protein